LDIRPSAQGSQIDRRRVINGTAKHGRETFAGTEQTDVLADETDVEIVKRKKKLSKELYSHVVSKDEAKFVFEKGGEQLIIRSGQDGSVQLSPEADVLRQQELPSCYSTDVAGHSRLHPAHVRFTPEGRHRLARPACPHAKPFTLLAITLRLSCCLKIISFEGR
jgi:hypothetical protein